MWGDGRQGMVAGFTPPGRGRVPVTAKIDIRWAHKLPGKPVGGGGLSS